MATIYDFITGQPEVKLDGNFAGVLENYISFAATNCLAADVVEVLNVAEGTFVIKTFTRILTAEGAAATATVGDATTANGWDGAIDMNVANQHLCSLEATDSYGVGKYYASADTIDFTLVNDTDAAIVYVAALCFWPERYSS